MNYSKIAERLTNRTLQNRGVGQTIYYQNPTESEVSRDDSGDIVGRPAKSIALKAFPIILSPGQKERDKAGVKEGISAIFYISLDEYKKKISKDAVDIIRHRIILSFEGKFRNYEIDQAHYKGTLQDGFRYIVIGGIEVL